MAITILALVMNSLWLLMLSRAITGFTAGSQPIAQAAMIECGMQDSFANAGKTMARNSVDAAAQESVVVFLHKRKPSWAEG